MFSPQKKFIFYLVLGTIFFVPIFSQASWSQNQIFFVDPVYDLYGRNKIEAQLLKTTNRFYFYADKQWYQNFNQKSELDNRLYNLSSNFEYKTYPILTGLFGDEDKPGVDNDSRLVIILEPLKGEFGGYVRIIDKYPSFTAGESNEGQIIYLNSDSILKPEPETLNYQLAHEFTHLITLNQKPDAEVWFYELISEVAAKIIGFNTEAITKQRAQNLLYFTSIKLTEWANNDKDYAKVYLLGLYLQEQFSGQLFSEALKYPSESGLVSLEEALKKHQTNFENVFLNWLIANIVNDCSLGKQYCYQDPALKGYSVIAYSYYLPTQSQSSLSVTDSIKILEAKWQKIIGGSGIMKLKFTIPEETPIYKIPYIVESIDGKKTIGFLDFTATNIQEIYVNDMGTKNKAIYFIPFIGLNGDDGRIYYYSWQASNLESTKQQEEEILQALLKKIEELKKQVALLQARLAMQKTYQNNPSCAVFSRDLYYGMNSDEVKCLQRFLANLGPEIYPEGLVTGYYGPLTQAAVQRYQALKGIITTGYFGPLTRAKVNQEL
ncbi:MAG: peptidoglycan-binding protein [Candidatus Pacebacteria bacterium]|nr:peptidoglycan-binding protein [Candidatus Paceibacterota bacterium]